jgi:hypothetical protein
MIDQFKRERMLKFFAERWKKDKSIVVFAGVEEAEGLPTIHKMEALAKALKATVHHVGMGVFIAKDNSTGLEVFSFLAGGAMQESAFGFSFEMLQIKEPWQPEICRRGRKVVIPALKKIAPAGWQFIKDEAKRKKALIAAAPALLEALRDMVEAVEEYVGMGGENPVGSVINAARSAIALAKGGA